MIEDTFSNGYNWCVEEIKMSQHSQLANDLEINKAVMFLRQKDFQVSGDAFCPLSTVVANRQPQILQLWLDMALTGVLGGDAETP